jgi:hypothetical protein
MFRMLPPLLAGISCGCSLFWTSHQSPTVAAEKYLFCDNSINALLAVATAATVSACSDLVLKQSVAETAAQFQQLLGNTSAAGGSGNSTGGNSSVSADVLREFVNRTMDNAGRWVDGVGVCG